MSLTRRLRAALAKWWLDNVIGPVMPADCSRLDLANGVSHPGEFGSGPANN